MDELLINAHLEGRGPVNLPWNINEEKRSIASCTGKADEPDASTSRFNHNKIDEIRLNKPTIEEPNGYSDKCDRASDSGHYEDETNILFCNTDITFTVRKTSTKEGVFRDNFRNQTHEYEQSFCENRISYNEKRPVHSSYTNLERKEACSYLATFSGTKVTNKQNKPRKSPKSSVKVSRQMIQECKLGFSDQMKPDNREKTSNCLLSKSNKTGYELGDKARKKDDQIKHKEDVSRVDKNHEYTKLIEPRVNNRHSSSSDEITKAEVDNQLDELLNVTEEALKCHNLKGKAQKVNIRDRHVAVDKHLHGTLKDDIEHIRMMTTSPINHTLNVRYDRSQRKTTHKYMSDKDSTRKETAITGRKYEKNTYDVSTVETNKHHYKNEEEDENLDKRDNGTCEEYSEVLIKHNQKNYNRETGEDKDEILKFTCQMMEIKQPKLTSKRRKGQSTDVSVTSERRRDKNNQTYENDVDITDHAKVEELNKKSEDLFLKVIRDRKKKRRKNTIVINVDPDCLRRRVQKKERSKNKLGARDVTEYQYATIDETKVTKGGDDDVFDISPAMNRDTFTDSESENTDITKQSNDTGVSNHVKLPNAVTYHKMHKPKASKSYTIIKHDFESTVEAANAVVRSKSIRGARKKTLKTERAVTKIRRDDNIDQCIEEYDRNSKIIEMGRKDIMNDNRLEEQEIPRKDNRKSKDFSKMARDVCEDNSTKQNDKSVLVFKSDVQETQKEWKWDDIIYDSDTDSYADSDYSSEHDYLSRPPTTASRELEFPRPASNRTFILYNKDDNGAYSCSSDEILSATNDYKVDDGDLNHMKEEKPGKLQRLFRWFMCCVRPKTDN